MPSTTHPRFREYGVYDRDSTEPVSTHPSRAAANAAKGLNHGQRVRGVPGTEYRTAEQARGGLLGWLFGGRR